MTIVLNILCILLNVALLAIFCILLRRCYIYTKTMNIRHFLFDPDYWCFATLNYEYHKFMSQNKSYEEFENYLTQNYIFGISIYREIILPEEKIELLFNIGHSRQFVERYLGQMPFTTEMCENILECWQVYMKERQINHPGRSDGRHE